MHGRGVFAVAPIAKGTRIFEYLGERVSHAAADKRYEDHDENDNHTFLFIVDRNTVIDAAVNGSDARFINHHCDGNCTSVIENRRVFIDPLRAIAPGEELGYDYEIGRDKDDPPNVDEIYACRCGSPKCRGSMLEAGGEKEEAAEAARPNGARREVASAKRQGAQGPASRGEAPRRTVTPARLIDQLAERGFGVADDFVDAKLLAELRDALRRAARDRRLASGASRARRERAARSRSARRFHLLAAKQPERDAEQRVLARLDELRAALNRALMTGLEDFQGHFALYPRGAGYARHFDRLVGTDVRAISAALYLNDGWGTRTADSCASTWVAAQRRCVAAGWQAGGVPVRQVRARSAARAARAHELHRLVPAPAARGLRVITSHRRRRRQRRDRPRQRLALASSRRPQALQAPDHGQAHGHGPQDLRVHRQAAARPAEHRRHPRH